MSRSVAVLALAVALVGTTAAPEPSPGPAPSDPARPTAAPAGGAQQPDADGWRFRDVVGEGWRVLPAKSPTLEFLREQGGLWDTEVPYDAGGELRTVPGRTQAPREAERIATVRVAVESGLQVSGAEFARQVMSTLNDPRGWGHDGSVSFARTDGAADIDITLASPATTDELCAPVDTGGTVSCGRVGFAVLNAARWAHGADPFLEADGTVGQYRRYLVNHEVGHVLGNPHVPCPGPGQHAPVMVQQTLGLDGCRPNGWPAVGS